MHFKLFCCAMQQTNLLLAFASYAALLSAAMLCAAIDIEAQRRSNETLSHRSHRLVKTLHHCFVCAAINIEAQGRSNETLSHRTHRLVKTLHHCFVCAAINIKAQGRSNETVSHRETGCPALHHCFVQQNSYKRDAASTIHLLIVRSTRVLQFVCVIARRLKL